MSWAVITGVSSGLGAIFAEQLAKRGHPLVLAGRDEAHLKAVAHRIDQNVELVVGDLGTTKGVEDLITQLANREIDVLVNNAGFGTYGPFAEIDAEREHELVAVNVDALVRLTHAVLPKMLARGRGGILNVASTIAFQPGPYQATYGASKAFVLSLSQALWAETRGTSHRDGIVPRPHPHRIRRRARIRRLAHRGLPTPRRARTRRRRRAESPGRRTCRRRARVAQPDDVRLWAFDARFALGARHRTDAAPGLAGPARSAQYREAALGGQVVEALLHQAAHQRIDVLGVRSRAEFGGDVDWRQHLGDDLGRQRHVHRREDTQPERPSESYWQDVGSEESAFEFGEPKQTRKPRAAAQVQLAFLPADGHRGNDRNPRLDGRGHVAGSAAEVDDVLPHARPVHVEVPARKDQHDGARSQCLRGVLTRRADHSGAVEEFAGRPSE